jgi:hypothetical protein
MVPQPGCCGQDCNTPRRIAGAGLCRLRRLNGLSLRTSDSARRTSVLASRKLRLRAANRAVYELTDHGGLHTSTDAATRPDHVIDAPLTTRNA